MKKEIMLGIAVIALVAMSGCLSSKGTTSSAFVGGTDGLTMQFQNLPSTVFPNAPFNILVLVGNAGETDIPQNGATFVLNNAANFGISPTKAQQTNSEGLAGSRKVANGTVPGEQVIIAWPDASFKGTVLTEEQSVPISVDACYPYKSSATASVCAARTDKICNPIGDKDVQSSGAPVQVTSLKQIAQALDSKRVQMQVTVEIENKGDGKVYSTSTNSSAQCPSPSIDYLDIVNVTGMKFGNAAIPFNCDENPIQLYQNKGELNCVVSINTASDIQDQLSIELAYKYKQSISSSIAAIPRSGLQA